MGDYAEDPLWSDVVPIPQDDGGPNPLAAINYTEGYAEAMSYLRAVMAVNEMSERALDLTEDIISMNPAHYTVWLYRAKIITALDLSLRKEVEWLNSVALAHQKNYQIWHHRQTLLDRLNDPAGEIAFINRMLAGDAKNYHVWSYRQWLVRRFGLWRSAQENGRGEASDRAIAATTHTEGKDDEAPDLIADTRTTAEDHSGTAKKRTTELEETELFIAQDVRNNSAWNHRFFVVNGEQGGAGVKDQSSYEREVSFAKDAVRRAPQNQSPWNYLRGTAERGAKGDEGVLELESFCLEFVDLGDDGQGQVRSSHALDLLAEIYGRRRKVREAQRAYDLLAETYDPVRVNYWNWLKGRLGSSGAAAVA